MKKILTFVALAMSTAVVSVASAETKNSNVYYSTLHPSTSAQAFAVPATNITVINYSQETIYAIVPNSPINDQLFSGKSDTISNNSYYGDTHLVLQDWNRSTFFDQYVCRHAIVTVDGQPGGYHINVDRKYC